ncbi:MAG: hypothetical protein ABW123_23720 [Cystobacter sp.]
MKTKRLTSLLPLLFVACHPSAGTPSRPDGGTGPTPPATFIVHMPEGFASSLPMYKSAHVLLGDGGKYRVRLDEQGMARFHAPELVGPRDVSLVTVHTSGRVQVQSFLALEGAEVWLPREGFPMVGFDFTQQATLTGKVTGADDSNAVSVLTSGKGFSGFTTQDAQGGFRIDVRGPSPGTVDVFARESDRARTKIVRVGMKRGIAVGGGALVSGLEVALDHPVDQSLEVTEEGAVSQGREVAATLRYTLNGQVLFTTEAAGALPLGLPAIAQTPPCDTRVPMLQLSSGELERLPGGLVQTERPVTSPSSAGVKFLTPVRITSPAMGTQDAPASQSREGLVLRWSPDASAHLTEVRLASGTDGDSFSWSVRAPASVTGFTPFTLPADITSVRGFRAGAASVWAYSLWQADMGGYEDFFTGTGTPFFPSGVEVRTTRLSFPVELR